MNEKENKYQVVIIGGGPVGLLLGCRLHQLGISFRILERRKEPISHSRSLGIHPVSLELFHELGIAKSFLDAGIKINRGLAFTGSKIIGEITFNESTESYGSILSLPQYRTEELLETHLNRLNPDALLRGAELTSLHELSNGVALTFTDSGNTEKTTADFIVGCDGKNSRVRELAEIPFLGNSYPDTYIMGDFSENTELGNDAAVFLPRQGLIESFPLEEGKRRWVVKTESYLENPRTVHLSRRVIERIGHDLSGTKNYMLSSFGVQKLVAETFTRGRIILAGDAAHVVSPIGGQGMNLGWLDAWDLSQVLKQYSPSQNTNWNKALEDYSRRRRKVTKKVIRRAEMNMRLGRATAFPQLRNALVWFMLNTPLKKKMARLFTMRDLDQGML